MKSNNVETHPSYGMIQFVRANGAGRLFGSPLAQHFGTIRLKISTGSRTHDYGEDRYRSEETIVEVEMSASQFAESITCMNMGEGVPCTLQWISGKGRIDGVPETENDEMHRSQNSFKKGISSLVRRLKESREHARELLEKDRLTKADRKTILDCVDRVVREIDRDAPWLIEQFQEATNRVASKAKAEVAAMFEHALRASGMRRILELQAGEVPELEAAPTANIST